MSVNGNGRLRKLFIVLAVLATAGLGSIGRAADRQPDDLFVWAENVLQRSRSRQSLVLVDIRSKDDFSRLRIPGSLNIPLAFIKTKAFLKQKSLVLVSLGYGRQLMEPECRRLKARGFRAAILHGGLSAWKQAGGRLQGDLTALGQAAPTIPRPYLTQRYPIGRAGRRSPKTTGNCLPCRRNE